MSDVTYEPTRDHWAPYEPWMRDALAADARASVASSGTESRSTWGTYRPMTDSWAAGVDLRIHPDDVPERPTEEPPVGSQVTDCMGDVWQRREEGWTLWWPQRAGWLADLYGDLDQWSVVLNLGFRPTTDEDRKRVGLPVDPAPDVDPAEALAKVLSIANEEARWDRLHPLTRARFRDLARAAREHIEADAEHWRAEFNQADQRIVGLTAERDEAEADLADMTRQRDALGRMADHNHDVAAKVKAERDEWKSRHEALRADVVEVARRNGPTIADRMVADRLDGILNRDDERGQA